MRKLVYTLIAVLGFTAMSFAQEAVNTASSAGQSELELSKKSGEYVFTLPATVTKEQVDKSAAYYTKNFSVSYDAESHVINLSMVENTKPNRTVMVRMMVSCGVQYIVVGNETIKLYDFLAEYL